MDKIHKIVATTMFGLEEVLEKELILIGAQNIVRGNRHVKFEGNHELIYKANLQLRTALKILKSIKSFKAKNEKDLYKLVSHIRWFKLFSYKQTFSITSTVNSKYFTHSHYVSLITKDAIVDQFKKKYKLRPSIDVENPDFNIHIHISNDRCNLYINSSGDSLHKRGYRTNNFRAPINEVLAAGIILMSDWDKNQLLIDPMCGSGTFLIESAMIAINKAPNILRNKFGFQKWHDYNETIFNNIKFKLLNEEKVFNEKILGFDISASAILIAKQHVQNMGLNSIIKISGSNFLSSDGFEGATIFLNPPYGKRIMLKDNYYKEIGDTLKQKYTNTSAWIISSDLEAVKKIGLRPTKKIKLFNGSLECRLLNYKLYKGSKKINKPQNE